MDYDTQLINLALDAGEIMLASGAETFRVQELHLPVYHTLCLMLEDAFFDGERK